LRAAAALALLLAPVLMAQPRVRSQAEDCTAIRVEPGGGNRPQATAAMPGAQGRPDGQVPPPQARPAQAPLRAQYDWGYAGPDGTGKGVMAVLLEPATGHLVLELHGLGERLMLLEGDAATGYRVRIPRRSLDTTAGTLGALPLPFLPAIGSVEALYQLLTEGKGPAVKVSRDKDGPRKLQYTGRDEDGREVQVWLTRTAWSR
jgi:hypothetical protein